MATIQIEAHIPSDPGTYVLVLRSDGYKRLQIGRLGSLDVVPGWYLYVGSAFGPGGLRARVGRHLLASKPRRWHVDHLRTVTTVAEVWCWSGSPRLERKWAAALTALPGASIPLPGFGASDSPKSTHLARLNHRPAVEELARALLGGHRLPCPPLSIYRQNAS